MTSQNHHIIWKWIASLYPYSIYYGKFVTSQTNLLSTRLTWAVLRARTQNNPQVVGKCPGHHPQPITQNRVFKIERL